MQDHPDELQAYERVHRLVESLLKNQKPKRWPRLSQEEAEVIRIAGVLNSAGATPKPRPEFVEALGHELLELDRARPDRIWSRLTRRGLLRGVASAAALLVAGGALERVVTSFGRPSPGSGWVQVAQAADLRPGDAVRFAAAGQDGYVLNIGGTLTALSALCTHLPCVLQWNGTQGNFLCPCHQAEFEADGRQRSTPGYEYALPPLPSFLVKEVGGVVYVLPGEAPAESQDQEEYELQ